MTPIAVPDESLPDEVELDLDATLDLDASLDVPDLPPPPPADKEEETRQDEQEIFVIVEEEGKPISPEVQRSAGEVLDKAALDAVMKLDFTPGLQRGKPVPVRFAIPVRFRLEDKKSATGRR